MTVDNTPSFHYLVFDKHPNSSLLVTALGLIGSKYVSLPIDDMV